MLQSRIHFDLDNAGASGMFLHHFRSVTVLDFVRIANPNDFWFRRVLPICYEDPVIKNIIAALGAAHRYYLEKPSKSPSEEDRSSMNHFERVAVSLYNEAITGLVTLDAQTSANGVSETRYLICCLLFVCLENMLGRFDEAVRHIKAGCELLKGSDISTASSDVRQLLQETATVLLRMNVDASIPPNEYDIPNVTSYANPLRELEDETQPFLSLAEARDAMWDLDVRMAYSCEGPDCDDNWSCAEQEWYGHDHPEYDSEAWDELSSYYRIWRAKLDLLIPSLGNFDDLPKDVQREILVLTASRCMWESVTHPTEDPKDEGFQRICTAHIDTIEQIYRLEASWLGRPVFTLDSQTIPSMFYTAMVSKDPVLIQRVIDLLRTYRRREGLWDSWKVADMISEEWHNPHSWFNEKHSKPNSPNQIWEITS